MQKGSQRQSTSPMPAAASVDIELRRNRVATLIGRLLARVWLGRQPRPTANHEDPRDAIQSSDR